MLLPLLTLGCNRAVQTLDNLTTVTDRETSSSDGVATFEIEVADGDSAFLFSASSDALLAVESVNDPDGYPVLRWEDWYYESESLTYAVFVEGKNVALNWPIRSDEGKLTPGTYTVTVGTYKANLTYEGDVEVNAVTQIKQDPNLNNGLIHVQIRYADGVGSDSVVTEATEEAVAIWEEIYADSGLSLSVDFGDADIDATLAYPGYDTDGALGDVGAEGTDYDITIVIGETIDGSMDYYGVSGGIPGTLVSTSTSVVVMSWLVHAGTDGSFSDLDLETYAGTLAHEVGHYVGLFHVVETDYAAWDAISDTPQCGNWSDCEDALGPNLMYPVSVCNSDWTECISQTDLTDGQDGVIHRYTGTL
ncbi:MAG: hypothetical protein ACI8RZ_007772 [Myxococcota bacterium]|jgi:hypothetical protein